jgi:glycine cleavage system H protein
MAALLVILTIVVAVAVDALVLARRRKRQVVVPEPISAMREPWSPHGVFLDRAHTWLRIGADGSLRVGIDGLLADALGEVERVELPEKGTRVERGEPLLTVHVKGRTLTVPAPASGEVLGSNPNLRAHPSSMVRDPYGIGWAVSLWARDHQEAIRPLRIGSAATAFLRAELQRLVDFLTAGKAAPEALTVLADGGMPFKGIAARLEDTRWQEFQTEFVSTQVEGR